ncbi:MAG: sodium-dependent transporter [Candidatus Gastranaerophilaceae bacterium]
MEKRDAWQSRFTFLMAAVASAIGLGNIWRFPGIVYQNGGGAFLIPFFVALVTAGIPLLAMEISIGKHFQKGAPMALKELNPKFEWIGWLGVGTASCIASYYSVVFAWVVYYVFLSFKSPWMHKQAADVFMNDVLQVSGGMFDIVGVNWLIFGALLVGWVIIWFCIRNGVDSISKVLNYVVTLPLILLVVLILRTITLPGALDGIYYYLVPDWSKLLDPSVWAAAYGQVFFSLSILFAIMVAYGSYLPKDAPVTSDSIIIALSDAFVSFFAGFACFGTLGYLSHITSTPINEMTHSGIMLAFVTYPTTIAAIPGGKIMVILFSLIFFILLFLLSLGSVFSIVVAVTTAFKDKFGTSKRKTATFFCTTGFLIATIYTTHAGLYWVDVVDHFMNDFNLILIGLIETVALAWIFGARKILEIINENCSLKYGNLWIFSIKYLCPFVFAAIIISYLYENIIHPYGGYSIANLLIAGWGFVLVTIMFSIVMTFFKDKSN